MSLLHGVKEIERNKPYSSLKTYMYARYMYIRYYIDLKD